MKRLGLLAGLALVAGCGHHGLHDYGNIPDKGQLVDGGNFVASSAAEASTLNPILIGDTSSQEIADLIFVGLLRYNPQLKLEGCLAESWKVSDGGKTIRFHLRKGLKWQDGQDLTSEDAAFTWRSIMDPKVATPLKSSFEDVSSVDCPDPLTFVVHYRKPFAPAVDSWTVELIPEHLLKGEKDLNLAAFNRNPVGDGPYKFAHWEDKQYVQLDASDSYFEGKPHIAHFFMRFIPEAATSLLEMKTQSVDSCTLQPDQYVQESNDGEFSRSAQEFRLDGRSVYSYLGFNLKREPFNDPKVRWALSHAIDRDALITGVLQGLGKPCSGPYSPLMPAYNPDVKPVTYDLAAAGKLLDEAGWKLDSDGVRRKNGRAFHFSIVSNEGNDARKKTVLILQQQFEKLGIQVDVQFYEWSLFLKNYINTRNFDTYVLGWQLSLDPDLYPIWHSSQTGPEQFNMVSYKNPSVDRLLEAGRLEFDPQKRIAIYRKIHALVAADQPYAFLYCPDELSALSLKIQGLEVLPTGYDWYWPQRWYIPASLQN